MKPFPTLLLLTALAVLGYLLLPRLSVRWQPGVTGATLRVDYGWPGAGPEAVEQQITAPLEGAFALVRGVQEIRSVSRQGSGYIRLQLEEGTDADFLRFRVASQVRRLYPKLPIGITYPRLSYTTPDDEEYDTPVLTYALSGPVDATALYRYATDRLLPQLSLQEGLARTEVTGGNRLQWRIALDPARIAVAGLTVGEVRTRLGEHFARSGLGFVVDGNNPVYAYRQDAPGEAVALTPGDWEALPLVGRSGKVIRLGELARVYREPPPARGYYRINGETSVRLLVYATPDANRLRLADEYGTRVRALEGSLLPGYHLRLEDDATEYLREELRRTRNRTLLSMGILLVFVLLAYQSLRRLLVVTFALAVNLGLAFLLYWLLGVELNLYAFAGIAVSFGIMIDNVIIMLDALRRPGGSRVGPAIAGATLTTLASLSVIFLLSAELRAQLYELARVMTINLSTSVAVALLLVPALTPRPDNTDTERLPPIADNGYSRLVAALVRYRKTVLVATILAFGLPLWMLPNRVDDWPLYNRTLGSPYYHDVLRPHVNRWLGGSFRLFTHYVYAGSGYRPPEETKLYVNAALPEGATVDQLNDVLLLVEKYLAGFGGRIDRYTSRVNSGQYGAMEITFPEGNAAFPFRLKNELTAFATNFGGVKWNIYGVGQGFSNASGGGSAGFRVEMRGYNQSGLDRHAGRLAELLLNHPRVQEVDTNANLNWWERDRAEYRLDFDRRELARRGLAVNSLRQALEWFDRSNQADLYLAGGEPVAITTRDAGDYDRWRLENWSVPVDTFALAFASVARLKKAMAPQALHKIDQQYLRMVEFEYLGSPEFGGRHLNACLDTLRAELPLGFSAERNHYRQRLAAGEMSYLMGLAVILIFFICALLFESLGQALGIVLLIPVSCIGVFLTFYGFDVRLDQGGYTSFLLVAGLAVNGLILVLSEYNYLRRAYGGHAGAGLYAEAVRRKITPILLTVVSTAAGLAPFLFGGRQEVFWHALAAGTIGGLAFSVLVIVAIGPVFFVGRR
ncbi:multidrug efflux pump subunit AcrB [Lewinella marina]|uniref:Multidrug efflux pump subunit AcrB n=1 Tax=Neolewinella marina TaxID=438751 RepID=A0A2G0CK49_9BACT|nr:efflux RND transporter permease subunit [Neolewinella marina]NJB84491.1 multidrug efflux pump subunit AcrB [Neolewinella marina]PHL00318.1 hypothetical protein CGL56_04605 [Neolewinella marina]